MKILVTGGAGFIGSAFVRIAADQGMDIVLCDKMTYAADLLRVESAKNRISTYTVDISDADAMESIFAKETPEAVLHFAAETHVDRSIMNPDEFVRTNVTGTTTLLRLSRKFRTKRFVHISTDEVYGDLPADTDLKFLETDPIMPNSPYAASKAAADMFVRSYIKTFDHPALIVRPSNNYGPWQYPEKLIPLTIAKTMLNEKIPVYGKGDNVRTWLYVDDCADGIFKLLQNGNPGEIYNIGSHEERRNIDVINSILELMNGDRGLIEFVPDRPGHDFRYAVHTEKISSATGWTSSTSFEEGLSKTVKWYVDHKDWLLKKKSDVEGFVMALMSEYSKEGDKS
ncbi:MAG: dTDP-glucose 4,6-dehydratase [Dissulfurispiraceae bacterium]|jgi:dTDP-glucose 4,6-dehydratase|nr:dTDP-glucose 4,6-dehydratase [Dissulfurispiraceae bacterium]